MNTIGERIKKIRTDADLSMDAFGKRIGVNSSSIAKLEHGVNSPAERTVKQICSVFSVNYSWLTEGEGEPYSNVGNTVLDMLVDEYNLSDLDRRIMQMYLSLTDAQREGIHAFVNGMIQSENKKKAD